jgi:hypothetical protein
MKCLPYNLVNYTLHKKSFKQKLKMSFQVLAVPSIKMTAFWDTEPCSLILGGGVIL